MQQLFSYLSLLFLLSGAIHVNAQTVNDVGVVWQNKGTMPISNTGSRGGQTPIVVLKNSNYAVIQYSTSLDASTSNIIFITEFTEVGEIVRQQKIAIPIVITSSQKGISHPRMIARSDGGILILIEFNHGGVDGTFANNNAMYRLILQPSDNAGYNGGAGWDIDSQGYYGIEINNFDNLDHSFVPKPAAGSKLVVHRALVMQTLEDNLHMLGVAFLSMINGAYVGPNYNGYVLVDDNGNLRTSVPSGYKNMQLFHRNNLTPTFLEIRNNTLTWIDEYGNVLISADRGKSWNRLASRDCVGCAANYHGGAVFNNPDGNYMLAYTSLSSPPSYVNPTYEIRGWKWDNAGNLLTRSDGSPFYVLKNVKTNGSMVQVNDNTILAISSTECGTSPNPASIAAPCNAPLRVGQYTLAPNSISFTYSNSQLSGNTYNIPFIRENYLKDGIMGASLYQPDASNRFQAVGKFTLCKNYVNSGITPIIVASKGNIEKTYSTTGAFSSSSETYRWEAYLKDGSLSGSHSTVGVGQVIEKGNCTLDPSGHPIVQCSFESATGAEVEIRYISNQNYGVTGNQMSCSTLDNFTAYIVPDINQDQTICPRVVPATITGDIYDNTAYTYQWQQSTDNGTTWVNALGVSNTQNYSSKALTQTTQYRRQTTRTDLSQTITSNTVTITVDKSKYIDVIAMPTIKNNIMKLSVKNIGTNAIPPITLKVDSSTGSQQFTVDQTIAVNQTLDLEFTLTTIANSSDYFLQIDNNICSSNDIYKIN